MRSPVVRLFATLGPLGPSIRIRLLENLVTLNGFLAVASGNDEVFEIGPGDRSGQYGELPTLAVGGLCVLGV